MHLRLFSLLLIAVLATGSSLCAAPISKKKAVGLIKAGYATASSSVLASLGISASSIRGSSISLTGGTPSIANPPIGGLVKTGTSKLTLPGYGTLTGPTSIGGLLVGSGNLNIGNPFIGLGFPTTTSVFPILTSTGGSVLTLSPPGLNFGILQPTGVGVTVAGTVNLGGVLTSGGIWNLQQFLNLNSLTLPISTPNP